MGYSPQGHKESDITEQLSVSMSTSRFGGCCGEEKQILVLLESFSLQPKMKEGSVINRRERWARLCSPPHPPQHTHPSEADILSSDQGTHNS